MVFELLQGPSLDFMYHVLCLCNMKDGWKTLYDEIYADPKKGSTAEVSPVVVKVVKYCKKGEALDLGAGHGQHTAYLLNKGFSVDAIDFSPGSIKKIKKTGNEHGKNLHAKVLDLHGIRLQKTYDIILCVHVLHNLSKRDRVTLLKKMQRHTRPGGYNVVVDPMRSDEISRLKHGRGMYIRFMKQGELGEIYKEWDVRFYKRERVGAQKKISQKETEPVWYRELLIAQKPIFSPKK